MALCLRPWPIDGSPLSVSAILVLHLVKNWLVLPEILLLSLCQNIHDLCHSLDLKLKLYLFGLPFILFFSTVPSRPVYQLRNYWSCYFLCIILHTKKGRGDRYISFSTLDNVLYKKKQDVSRHGFINVLFFYGSKILFFRTENHDAPHLSVQAKPYTCCTCLLGRMRRGLIGCFLFRGLCQASRYDAISAFVVCLPFYCVFNDQS